ncbi:cysteine desulfurase [archaeon]|nr:cysteine desulfurase [archaeon]
MKKEIYLDNGATTRVDEKVALEMERAMTACYGNPSSLHLKGEEAKRILENARAVIAKSINALPEEIIFTSGGTESDNLAVKGIALEKKKEGRSLIVTSLIEHPAVHGTCNMLKRQGFRILYVKVNNDGIIDMKHLENLLFRHKDDIALVTIMHANNEIGRYNILFHTDAVQSFTKEKIDVKRMNIGALSLSAHKIHGPKGVGALYIRKGIRIEKQMHGGHQESDLRAGTENISGILGFARAVELEKQPDLIKIKLLRDRMIKGLLEIKDAKLNGSLKHRLCNNVNINFKGVEGESLLLFLSNKGICISTGSACSSQSLKPSHVLLAIGLGSADAHGSIRLTLSRFNTKKEIEYTIKAVKEGVQKLREVSGYVFSKK